VTGPAVALLVVSDRAAAGVYDDRCAPLLKAFIEDNGGRLADVTIIPDGIDPVRSALRARLDAGGCDLILTVGGTGVSPRDLTPEATRPLIEREVPGIPEAMRAASRAITPNAILSRGLAGFVGSTLIVNLPGSPNGAVENLASVWSALSHGVKKAHGDPSDCAPPRG
jgi:molybdenum cofactor synthesis domain-containing protein